MLDIGGSELLVILVVALVVLGPKELPAAIRSVSMWMRRARELAREFQGGLDDIAREAEIEKLKAEFRASMQADELKNAIRNDVEAVRSDLENRIDPGREIRGALDAPPDRPVYDPEIAREIAKTPPEHDIPAIAPPAARPPEPGPVAETGAPKTADQPARAGTAS
ncbi:MAG: twin-arginine translocase subunit TatB [Alphaproteobacteria bacterium]|nr:twin-arginine translocase subunit TatB [Alphaproteobacteria bacterium]